MVFESLFETASKKRKDPQSATTEHLAPTRDDLGGDGLEEQGEPEKKKRRRRKKKKNPQLCDDPPVAPAQEHRKKKVRPPKTQHQRKKGPPSAEALALSSKLKEFSSQKRLTDALSLYWDKQNDRIRDGHHACIVVDCCARCGSIAEAERVIDGLRSSSTHVNVETKTALLKGYAHAGMMAPAADLFREMCQSKDVRDLPNVRTLNTLLRGCLWTAASFDNSHGGSRRLVGGLVTAHEVWDLCKSLCHRSKNLIPDLSSYEYYITQLCYALRVDDANLLIGEMRHRFGITSKDDGKQADPSSLDTLTIVLTAHTRAYALLGKECQATKVAKQALGFVDLAKQNRHVSASPAAAGGKRAWREERKDQRDTPNQKSRRENSNALFRAHRLSEVEREARYMVELSSNKSVLPQPQELALFLSTRVMYLSGGGTTVLSSCDTTHEKEVETLRLLNNHAAALFHSFGLNSISQEAFSTSKNMAAPDCRALLGSIGKATEISSELEQLLHIRNALNLPTQADVLLSLPFEDNGNPLLVELGSGSGDWIVGQASLNPGGNYVAVELRSDRCAQTFSKMMLSPTGSPLRNICCVASDCRIFLGRFQSKQPVSRIYVNHPEPPTQTYGSSESVLRNIAQGGAEPAHMLASDTLQAALQCLAPQGQLVVVSDNLFYARLICATLVKVLSADKKLQLGCSSVQSLGDKYRQLETFQRESKSSSRKSHVKLFEGQPSEAIGHYVSNGGKGTGSSYFDRLWKAGAGKHADRRSRYTIVIQRSE